MVRVLSGLNADPVFIFESTFLVTLFLCLSLPPGAREWRLTAPVRIVKPRPPVRHELNLSDILRQIEFK